MRGRAEDDGLPSTSLRGGGGRGRGGGHEAAGDWAGNCAHCFSSFRIV